MTPIQLTSTSRCVACATALAAALVTVAGCQSAGPATPPAAADAPLVVPAGYRLVWADEFSTNGLPDSTKWGHDTERNQAGWHNHELQYYSGPRAENAVVKDGLLVITARKEDLPAAPDWGGQHYTSARLLTRGKGEWTYGYFEVRARMPCGKGTWPAIWTLGTGGRWPDDGELDIMEYVGSKPSRVTSAVHTAAGSGGNGVGGEAQVPDACQAFHNYQMHWTPEGVRFGVDGVTHLNYVNTKADPKRWPFDAPQFLLLNIAIGGDLGGPVDDGIFPVQMEVDYVRVYQAAK